LGLTGATPTASGSLRLQVAAEGGSATSFVLAIDDLELLWEPPLFSDGFESGDTSAWNETVG
jgi:hypothetical protein